MWCDCLHCKSWLDTKDSWMVDLLPIIIIKLVNLQYEYQKKQTEISSSIT